ncbi:Asp-tRNA(Asn)/Glu-tRNA(Gln) amidotransferase subunit GatB [Candidatus Beckwithbacteria bacterium]|nr:Asp-tRNA(Asn)/Glu-tRNA(Gln) amidotransferase subunit GatB [Candidatus Beckwithbacteria bacterium]
MNKYQPIIGLEIHVELKTKSKMFCGCSASHFQVKPNTHTCPVCLGLPGALPVPNRKAIEWCQLIGLALNCQLAKTSKFDRKNYFYPDLAKGYQISQYDQPLCFKGRVKLSSGTEIGITRVHMEEDTGKSVHKDGKTLVDFNRSGVPLVEIVTEPDFRSTEDVDEFLKLLQKIIRYLKVSDADMEKGSMRLEVNMSLKMCHPEQSEGSNSSDVSVSPQHDTNKDLPNYKVEVKNINSFRYVQKAIAYEAKRQADILDQGETPAQETRGYQEDVDKTVSQRSKEEAQDYRYFPEPDIPPMEFTSEELDELKSKLPELPDEKLARFVSEYKLPRETAQFLTDIEVLAKYYEETIKAGKGKDIDSLTIANAIKNKKVDWQKLKPEAVIEQIAKEKAETVSDTSELEPIIEKVLAANPQIVAQYKAGKTQVLGFLVGQVMRETQGKADAKIVNKLLHKKI